MQTITSDFEPFWMFEEGAKVPPLHSREVKSAEQLKDPAPELSLVLYDPIGITKGLAQIFYRVDQSNAAEILRKLLTYLEAKTARDFAAVTEVTFDLALLSFPHYALVALNEQSVPSWTPLIEGLGKWFSRRKGGLLNFLEDVGAAQAHFMRTAALRVDRCLFAFLANCKEKLGIISDQQFDDLAGYFLHDDPTKFAKLKPYGEHPLGPYTIDEMLTKPRLYAALEYVRERYGTFEGLPSYKVAFESYERYRANGDLVL